MIGGKGLSRSLLGRIEGVLVHLLIVFATLQVSSSQEDAVK